MAQPWAPPGGASAELQKNFCHCVICGKGMHYPAYSTPQGITYCEDHRPDKEEKEGEARIRLSSRSTSEKRSYAVISGPLPKE